MQRKEFGIWHLASQLVQNLPFTFSCKDTNLDPPLDPIHPGQEIILCYICYVRW